MADDLEQLRTKTLEKISESGEVSSTDIFLLRYCEREAKKRSYVSPFKQVLNGAGEVLGFVKLIFGGE